nr:glycosyl hydrolase [Bacteroidota bacterium]
ITWSTPVRINKVAGDCIDSDNTVEGAVPAVGPNGEIYVAWAGPNGLVFNRSFDEGNTWLSSETPIDPMPGWDYAIPGIYRANGLPVTACDVSGGAYTGTVYVNWSDQRNGASNTDVWLAKSTDSGRNMDYR